MEIPDRQQIDLALGQPGPCGSALAFGTMPVAATVIGDPLMAAVRAGLDVTPKGGGAAMLEERTRFAGLVALLIALRRIVCLVLFEFLNGPT